MVLFYNGGDGWDIVWFLFTWCSSPTFLFVSRYVGSGVVWMCSMVVVSLNSFCRRANSCTEDSFRWCGILILECVC